LVQTATPPPPHNSASAEFSSATLAGPQGGAGFSLN
jgi:hypothetical protein